MPCATARAPGRSPSRCATRACSPRSRSATRAPACAPRTCPTCSTASGAPPGRRREAPASASRSRSGSSTAMAAGSVSRTGPRAALRSGSSCPRSIPDQVPHPVARQVPSPPRAGAIPRLRRDAAARREPVIAPPSQGHPPLPRADSIVDPRVGDAGPALLALEDGTVFPGIAFGAPAAAGGDLVVNTSQTGYQEVCTDPSYAGQVVVMTYPLIGNYGRLLDDDQSLRPWLRGLVVANATAAVLEDAQQLARLLRDTGIPAIAGVDTRG